LIENWSLTVIGAKGMFSLVTVFSLMMIPAIGMLTISLLVSALENDRSV